EAGAAAVAPGPDELGPRPGQPVETPFAGRSARPACRARRACWARPACWAPRGGRLPDRPQVPDQGHALCTWFPFPFSLPHAPCLVLGGAGDHRRMGLPEAQHRLDLGDDPPSEAAPERAFLEVAQALLEQQHAVLVEAPARPAR